MSRTLFDNRCRRCRTLDALLRDLRPYLDFGSISVADYEAGGSRYPGVDRAIKVKRRLQEALESEK